MEICKRTDNAKHGSEEDIEVVVSKARDRASATTLESGRGRAHADAIGDKGRRGAIEVAAAGELQRQKDANHLAQAQKRMVKKWGKGGTHCLLHKALYRGILTHPDIEEVGFEVEGEDPQVGTKTEAEEAADENGISGDFEDDALGQDEAGQEHEKRDEHERSIDDTNVEG